MAHCRNRACFRKDGITKVMMQITYRVIHQSLFILLRFHTIIPSACAGRNLGSHNFPIRKRWHWSRSIITRSQYRERTESRRPPHYSVDYSKKGDSMHRSSSEQMFPSGITTITRGLATCLSLKHVNTVE